MGFRANVNIELEAATLPELLTQIALVGGSARVTYSGPQTSEANVSAETPAPKPAGRRARTQETSSEQSKPQVESSQASSPQAATSPAAGGEASSPAQPATQDPAPAPASVKTKSKDELVSELRAILTPYAQKGQKERGAVNEFVKAKGYSMITDIPAEALPALIEEAKEKF